MLAFYPEYSGYFGSTGVEDSARSRFWSAALSTGERSILVRGLLERWPRLAGPAFVTVLASWLLFKTGAYFHQPAAALTHSSWFAHFAGAHVREPLEPTLASAALQGAILAFLRGDYTYDSSQWTMGYEFYGGFMVYSLGFLLVQGTTTGVRIVVIAGAALACRLSSPVLAPFVVGVALAALLPRRASWAPASVAAGAVVLALLMSGYTRGAGGFCAGATAARPAALPVSYVYAIAAAILIAAAEGSSGMKAFLSRRWGVVSGEPSLPFYRVHVPMPGSLGAFTLIATGSKATAIAATLTSSLAAAWLLQRFNPRWIDRLNVGVAALLSSAEKRQRQQA